MSRMEGRLGRSAPSTNMGGDRMSRMTGRTRVARITDGGALATGANLDPRLWGVPALILGAVLACISTDSDTLSPNPPSPLSLLPAVADRPVHPAGRKGSVSEFYRNGPYGLEQGFTVRQRPQADKGCCVSADRSAQANGDQKASNRPVGQSQWCAATQDRNRPGAR